MLSDSPTVEPAREKQWVIIWRIPKQEPIRFIQASKEDLFALKLVAEDIDYNDAVRVNQVSIGDVDRIIYQAVKRGILLSPPSKIRRNPAIFSSKTPVPEEFLSAGVFSIQWHITNACDLNCKHCYDRSRRSELNFDDGLRILDDLYVFCKERFVRGNVCFTGGNPFLYPQFTRLYREAHERGFGLSILANPVLREKIQEILDICPPHFFQISLEGLRRHNDYIRGAGHYERSLEFLRLLKQMGVCSSVMLTLTRDNLDQIIPLAGELVGLTDSFTFNRLSQVGEGAKLELPDKNAYTAFLIKYAQAAKQNEILYYKDNLLNILRYKNGENLFDGCTGFGCGAAFNFITVLPDGQAHACRKFPSLIGNVFTQKIADIYDSPIAQKYRNGCKACNTCPIRHACGGCMAISNSFGLDIYSHKDPHCFMHSSKISI